MRPRAVGDAIKLVVNTELTAPTSQSTASSVNEPSCAISGNVVLYTGNWYAARSADGGKTFSYLNPEDFPSPSPGVTFCCDQIAHYIPNLDVFVWLLQYSAGPNGNIQRLAFAKPADVVAGNWRLFDITPAIVGVPLDSFLDYPDLAVGANCLYMTTNVFKPNDAWHGTAIVRIPFSGIRTNAPVAQPYLRTDIVSGFRLAQNLSGTAYFAAHEDTSTLSVFTWREGDAAPIQASVAVARWLGGNGYLSGTPDGHRWLDRADSRLTGGVLAHDELWFAWGVDRGSNHRPRPFIQIARIDAQTMTTVENINIFDAESATCYASLSANAEGEIGISYMTGGGNRYPSHVVGILTGARQEVVTAEGDRAPKNNQWGDYLTVRPVHPTGTLFAATGFTMKGAGNSTNRDATPRFVVFGRERHTPPGEAAPGHPIAPPTTVADLTTPFDDVNKLATVSPQTAQRIKAACIAEGRKEAPAELEAAPDLQRITKPGVERWPVKTGDDRDLALVGKNVIDGQKLETGIVDTTIEELAVIDRPPDMRPAAKLHSKYQERRRGPVELTVWRFECDVIAVKLERDGDYHLVLQGASGQLMIGETPLARAPFVDPDGPWLKNMRDARKAVDERLISKLSPQEFVQFGSTLVPREAADETAGLLRPQSLERLASFVPPEKEDEMPDIPTFQAKVKPTRARVTGVGFFDRVHGATGAANSGLELHPILKIEWL